MNTNSTYRLFFLMVLHCISYFGFATIPDSNSVAPFQFLPQQRLIPAFTADGRAHRMNLQLTHGTNELIGSMGGVFPVAQYQKGKRNIQLSAAATMYTTLIRYITHGSLINIDFFVDLYLDLQLTDRWYLRTGIGHTSQHLSDDAATRYEVRNYVRDYGEGFIVYRSTSGKLMCYAGGFYNDNFKTTEQGIQIDYSGKVDLQLGFEHIPVTLGKRIDWYYAADVKIQTEFSNQTTRRIQTGFRTRNNFGRVFRFAINHTSGLEERGQFYKQQRSFWSTGFFFDF